LINADPGFSVPRVLTFTSHDLPIPLPKSENFRTRGGRNVELTLPELARIGSASDTPAMLRDTSRSAFHYRLVEVVSILLLPLLALALGVPPKRSSSSLGVFLSVMMIVTYHKVNEYAEAIGGLGLVDPFIALWGPFVLFAALVFWMYYQIAYVPGGQPIGALEKGFASIGKAIMRRLPQQRKQTTP
jgi:lipopolysaccharide export system permease protein